MDAEENILIAVESFPRSRRLGVFIEPGLHKSVDRTERDQVEIARRVQLYAAQYERTRQLNWQPHKCDGCS